MPTQKQPNMFDHILFCYDRAIENIEHGKQYQESHKHSSISSRAYTLLILMILSLPWDDELQCRKRRIFLNEKSLIWTHYPNYEKQ